jgi:RNA polymerase sigma-70 factor (ECF subfamily)
MAAFSRGDVAGVAQVLAEDAVWMSDAGPHRLATRRPIHGRDRISRGLAGLAAKVPPELDLTTSFIELNGTLAVAVFHRGELERVLAFETSGTQITAIRILVNPDKLRHLAESLGRDLVHESPFALPRAAIAQS